MIKGILRITQYGDKTIVYGPFFRAGQRYGIYFDEHFGKINIYPDKANGCLAGEAIENGVGRVQFQTRKWLSNVHISKPIKAEVAMVNGEISVPYCEPVKAVAVNTSDTRDTIAQKIKDIVFYAKSNGYEIEGKGDLLQLRKIDVIGGGND